MVGKKFVVMKPSSFYSNDKPIVIFDEKKYPFYFHPNKLGSITFNLPIGKYYTKSILKEIPFIPYEKQMNVKPDTDYGFNISDNPHKATITPFDKKITVDKKIDSLKYLPAKQFIVGHEIGHTIVGGDRFDSMKNKIFDAEKWCDRFSENYMLANGWNPTQVKFAKEFILSNVDRKNCIDNRLHTHNYRP
jgi:hypothetical protein